MHNLVYVIGRLVNDPEIKETENNRKVTTITIAVNRSYKNCDGVYETDFIPVILWNGIAENTTEYCKKGDLLGVKGRIERLANEELTIVADKISFLATRKED